MQFARWIIQVAKYSCLGGAYLETSRLQSFFQAMNAKCTFFSRTFFGIDKPASIGTGLNAIPTADAIILIN